MRKRSTSFLLACLLLSAGCAFGQYAPNAPSAPQQATVPQTTQSPQPAIDCAGHADGLYVRNPNECNDGFYKCANDRSFYYRCPTGLFFSIEDAQCEYRQLIPACGGQRPAEATTPAQQVQVYQPQPPRIQAPAYQPPQTQAPAYQPPQTQAPTYQQPTTTQAPAYQPPQTQAPVYVQPTTTQAPVYQPPPQTQAPVYQPPPQTQAPVYQPPPQTQAPVYVQPTTTQTPVYQQPPQTQAPVYQQPPQTQAPVYQPPPQTQAPAYTQAPVYQQSAPSASQISYASSAPVAVAQPQYAPVQQAAAPQAVQSQPTYQQQYGSQPAAPQFAASTRPPVNFNCQGQSEGYHAKRPCVDNVYYSCVGGIATQLNCAPGTVYDPVAQACDYPSECGKPKTTTSVPLYNYGYGWQPRTTAAPSTECNGRMDGFYARGHCVKDYLHCSNGIAFNLKCPSGLVFRNDSCTYLNDCLSPTTAAPQLFAQTGPTLPPLTWCRDNQKQTGFYGQGCSQKFYSCNGGFTAELSCPGVLFYDQTTGQCDERQFVVACGGRPRPPTTTTIAAPVAPVRRPNFNCQGKGDGFHTTGCSGTYYACVGGQAINALNCPAQLAYDQTSRACEEQQYVVACGGRPRPSTTPAPAAAVKPSNFNCQGLADGYYYNSNVRCSSTYYHCSSGVASDFTCSPGTSYSPQIHACDYRGNIPECGGTLPTTTQPSAPIAIGNQGGSGQQYGYAPQTQAPTYQQPTTTQAPVYQPPQTQAPVYVQPTTTQAPVYQPPPQTQAPVYQPPPQTQAPVYQPPPQTQAPVYQQPPQTQPQYPQYSAPSYPQQQFAQQPSAPVSVAQPDNNNNQCAHLQNGIYGKKCSRNYIVCTDHKIFEFTCPSGFAYDRTIARCGPVDKIQGCASIQAPQTPPSGSFRIRRK